jgi:integrating conjugative element protein (TIGR03761 family)
VHAAARAAIKLGTRNEEPAVNDQTKAVSASATTLVEDPEHLLPDIGALVDEAPDTMVLHSREAYRLFIGRALEVTHHRQPIIGGRRVAAALRAIWYLSGNDNPYADWVLVDIGERISEIGNSLQRETQRGEDRLHALSRRGLNLSVLQSREPQPVELVFRSSYGYAVADLVLRYDYFNRVIKTLVRKDLLPDHEGRSLIFSYTRRLRGMFEEPVRFERWLMRDELRPLSRRDFLPAAEPEARKRVQAAMALFGPVPRDVFTGARRPRHSRRRVELTAQELKLLQDADLTWSPATGDAEEATLL